MIYYMNKWSSWLWPFKCLGLSPVADFCKSFGVGEVTGCKFLQTVLNGVL